MLSMLPGLCIRRVALLALSTFALNGLLLAATKNFRGAPDSAKLMTNPFGDSADAIKAGKPLYHLRCARCHGERGEGSGNIPPLRDAVMHAATPGEVFWFITKGDVPHEMPSWASLPKEQRWKIVSYVKTLGTPQAAMAAVEPSKAGQVEPAAHASRPLPIFAENFPARSARSPSTIFLHRSPQIVQQWTRSWFPARRMPGRKRPQDSRSNSSPPDWKIQE